MSTISASTTSTTAYVVTADTTGTLVLKTGSTPTTAVTIGSDQSVTFAGAQTYTGASTFSSSITVQGITVGRGASSLINNTAVGASALQANTTGNQVTSIGKQAAYSNTTGNDNTFVGYSSGYSNTTGSSNTVVGKEALANNTTASNNTAVGYQAGYSTTGGYNTFVGIASGNAVTSGTKNTIIGSYNGNQYNLDLRTASNYIVLSDGDGNPRYRIDQKGNLQNDTAYNSNSLLRQISRGGGNATETFTAADMGMSDNMTCLINVSLVGTTTFNTYGGTLLYWYMPYGGNSAIQSTLVAAFKGAGITTFSVSASGNSLVVSKDSARGVSVTVIGGGGIAVI